MALRLESIMALRLVQFNEATGKFKRGPIIPPVGYIDEEFDTTSTETTFAVVENFTATQKIDVYVNGTLKREGVSKDYTRNDVANSITFAVGIPTSSWVRVRVWPE
jgi:hypothetical protein